MARWKWNLDIPLKLPHLTLACVGFVAIGLAVLEMNAYGMWGSWIPSAGPPPRIQWCGRRYYPGPVLMSAAEVRSEVAAATHGGGLREIARSPSGYGVFAAPMTAEQQSAFHTDVCAMVVYVRLAEDSYRPYPLSGGP